MKSTCSLRSVLVVVALAALTACGTQAVVESEELVGAADETAQLSSELSTGVPVGSLLAATTAVNMRTGASTNYRVILVVPKGGRVRAVSGTPTRGWYKVSYAGRTGWVYGAYLTRVSSPAPTSPRDRAIARAKTGVGFSYYWGHGRWLSSGATSSNRGSCYGGCPSCRHSGSNGADCSGFAAKVWQVPSWNTNLSSDAHPYSTYNFRYESHGWYQISRSNLKKADALVYNSSGSGHIIIYEGGSPWGSQWAYEAKGCAYGIRRNLRTTSSAYRAIRHSGW